MRFPHASTPGPTGNGAGGHDRRRGGVVFLNWRDTSNPEGGGSELYVERIAAGLAAQGRPVTMVCAGWPGAPREEHRDGVRILRRGSRLTVYLWAFLLHLGGRLGPHEVVVDVQNGLPFFSTLYTRRPVVVLCHHVHREQWQVLFPAPLARLGWWVESRLAPLLYRRCHYVTVSGSTRRELIGLGVRAASIRIVRNGTEVPIPAGLGARSPFPSICILGRLVPHKRVELALAAAARIRETVPDLQVFVAGQGWWEARVRLAVSWLGMNDAVHLLGYVDDQLKDALLAQSWVLAMPSLKEGWGLAVLEAAGHGTPAVGFRAAGGLAESIVDEVTGLLADDTEELGRQLARVLGDPGLRDRLGAAARTRAARFTWPAAAEAFAEVLDEATSRARTGQVGAEPVGETIGRTVA
ncbi:MAG TPA: glycosyltransferase family 4 protein [Actinomycetota bacterium]|jgi:glycosyltransferase involved in cell wall biosynthesis|nr:glycosyltransferase family 4 protein [Actinomycetota bacterium]